MVKVGGKNTCKVGKKLLNFLKTAGKIVETEGKIINFGESGGNKTGKIGGKSEICGR